MYGDWKATLATVMSAILLFADMNDRRHTDGDEHVLFLNGQLGSIGQRYAV